MLFRSGEWEGGKWAQFWEQGSGFGFRDTSAAPLPEAGRPGQRRSAGRDHLKGGVGGALEKESQRRSYPLNAASLNGAPKGGKYDDVTLSGAEAAGGGCMKTGLWKSETTV